MTIDLRLLLHRIFLVAALVLFVFMLIGTQAADTTCLGVVWPTWLAAGLMAVVVDQLVVVVSRDRPARVVEAPPQ